MSEMNRAPIAVLSFSRPHYLDRTLASLKAQAEDLSNRTVALFQDGTWSPSLNKHHCNEDIPGQCVEVFRSHFPSGAVFNSKINLGSIFNYERAEQYVFQELNAPAAIFLEDDLVLGKAYLTVLQRLLDLAAADERIGYVTAFGNWHASREAQLQNPRKLVPMHLLWAFGLTQRHWRKCRPYVEPYLDIVRGSDYRRRDHEKIRELTRSWEIDSSDTGQDRIKAFATALTGCIMINTQPVYGSYIGEEGGLNFTPTLFRQWKLDKMEHFDEALSLDFDLSTISFDPFSPGANVKRRAELTQARKIEDGPMSSADKESENPSGLEKRYIHLRQSFLPWEPREAEAEKEQAVLRDILRRRAGLQSCGKGTFIAPDAYIFTDSISIGDRSYIAGGAVLRGEISIGSNSTVNPFTHIAGRVVIGDGVRIAGLVSIYAFNHGFDRTDIPIYKQPLTARGVEIGDGTWIGANVTITDGVVIGAHCVIGAGSVVTKGVPDYSVVAGNPAVIIRNRKQNQKEMNADHQAAPAPIKKLLFLGDPFKGIKPPFERDLQGWDSKHPIFREVISQLKPKLIVEVGTWKGASAIHMAQICREMNLQSEIVCIDTWLGNWQHWSRASGVGSRQDLRLKDGFPQLYYQFLSNVLHCGFDDIITPLPLTGVAGAKLFQHYKIFPEVIYIDGDHEYESVLFDLRLWVQQMAPGGILIGDDYVWPGVKKAATEIADEFGLELKVFGQKFTLRSSEKV